MQRPEAREEYTAVNISHYFMRRGKNLEKVQKGTTQWIIWTNFIIYQLWIALYFINSWVRSAVLWNVGILCHLYSGMSNVHDTWYITYIWSYLVISWLCTVIVIHLTYIVHCKKNLRINPCMLKVATEFPSGWRIDPWRINPSAWKETSLCPKGFQKYNLLYSFSCFS